MADALTVHGHDCDCWDYGYEAGAAAERERLALEWLGEEDAINWVRQHEREAIARQVEQLDPYEHSGYYAAQIRASFPDFAVPGQPQESD